jgi:polysaccharide biosynthesis/export protein
MRSRPFPMPRPAGPGRPLRVGRLGLAPMALAALALGVSGCGSLPRGAAVSGEVLRQANAEGADCAVYPVTSRALPALAGWPEAGERPGGQWLPRSRGAATPVLKPGDRVALTIWDTDENSLLTTPTQKSAAIPEMTVGADGEIFVPYLGGVYVGNMTPQEARDTVQGQIETVLPSAQVQLALTAPGRRNSVDLVGGVTQPGPVPLPDRDFTVLGLIGQGGGPNDSIRNPRVRLVRDGRDYSISLERLYAEPALDTTLRGGDQVIVVEDERYFLSLGAAGAEEIIPFGKDTVSALDAMSMMGGVNDQRGNPKGILILREYPVGAVRPPLPVPPAVEAAAQGPVATLNPAGPSKPRVVFTLDLTSADGLFAARSFLIRPGDLVLATESRVTSAETILGLVGRGFGVVRTATTIN